MIVSDLLVDSLYLKNIPIEDDEVLNYSFTKSFNGSSDKDEALKVILIIS